MPSSRPSSRTFLFLAFLLLPASGWAVEEQVVDRIVAVVNDQIILYSELLQQSAPLEERAAQNAPDRIAQAIARKQVRQKVLEEMVADRLIESQAKDLGITVSDREIEQDINRIKKEYNLSDADFARQMAQQGLDEKGLREYLRKQRMRQKVLEVRVTPRVLITDAEVRAYYEENYKNDDEVRFRMISKRIPRDASDAEVKAVEAGLSKLRAEIVSGKKDFGDAARVETEGANPAGGGDQGWIHRGDLQPEIEEVAFALKPGPGPESVSQPIQLNGAWHILQVTERRANPPKPFEAVAGKIREVLFNRAGEKEYDRWISELKTKSFVEERLDAPVAPDNGK